MHSLSVSFASFYFKGKESEDKGRNDEKKVNDIGEATPANVMLVKEFFS